ncbi:hypothetical protein [Streptomyces sp. NPDC048191]|uniref:hypothetical protein n=1 Tax=Streptomyces sp. NPDC048191 TaxID=3155484 RepID=UPI0033D97AC0
MPVPAVAVVAPLTGPRTAAGIVLLTEVDRIRDGAPGTADWQVFHETPGVGHAVASGDYTAVVGHADPSVIDGALDAYQQAGLTCLLPLLPGRPPALSWAPDETRLARILADGAVALGATALTVAYDDDHRSAALAALLATRARATGLTVRTGEERTADEQTADEWTGDVQSGDARSGASGAVLALLAPQHRLPALLRALEAGRWQAVLVVADCGLPSFDALVTAAVRLPVWAVHPEPCLVRRTRAAVASLAAALAENPSLRGDRLAARIVSRSVLLLGPGGGVLGEGRRVSRLSAVCPIRAAAREEALAGPRTRAAV